MTHTIYYADNNKADREQTAEYLTREGFEVTAFTDCDELLAAFRAHRPDLVILDILMPGTDGLSACSILRREDALLPILIVSAKDSPYDRVIGLTLGCDDYLVKPFLPLELAARVKALLRRANLPAPAQTDPAPEEIRFGPLTLFPERRSALLDGKPFPLTPTEFDFLSLLASRADGAVKREELLKALWKVDWQTDTRAPDDMVKRLRRKLRERGSSVCVETVWGYGFRLAIKEA